MSKAIKTLAIATILAACTSAAVAQSPPPYSGGYGAYDAPPIHRGPIYNGFNHQPRRQDLPPAVQGDEGHIAPSQRDFDKSLKICRPC
jgi:hypothetical protein